MYKIVCKAFGGVENLEIVESADPTPGPGQVVVRVTSIGMNHADLMQRRGEYKATSGEPPFVPGLEAGGVIEAVGDSVTDRRVGQRVTLRPDATRRNEGGQGAYQSHFVGDVDKTIVMPDGIADQQIGAVGVAYLTAWGCLIKRQQLRAGQTVLLPAASSAVAIAAAQVIKEIGGVAIGTTTSRDKIEKLLSMPEAPYDHIIYTGEDGWHKQVRQITENRGCDVIFDPVAAGMFLSTEIRLLATHGTIWIYGLLGEPGVVDVTPLILKRGVLRGFLINELADDGPQGYIEGFDYILPRIVDGRYKLPVAGTFSLRDVRNAHTQMEKGKHIGKLILIP